MKWGKKVRWEYFRIFDFLPFSGFSFHFSAKFWQWLHYYGKQGVKIIVKMFKVEFKKKIQHFIINIDFLLYLQLEENETRRLSSWDFFLESCAIETTPRVLNFTINFVATTFLSIHYVEKFRNSLAICYCSTNHATILSFMILNFSDNENNLLKLLFIHVLHFRVHSFAVASSFSSSSSSWF